MTKEIFNQLEEMVSKLEKSIILRSVDTSEYRERLSKYDDYNIPEEEIPLIQELIETMNGVFRVDEVLRNPRENVKTVKQFTDLMYELDTVFKEVGTPFPEFFIPTMLSVVTGVPEEKGLEIAIGTLETLCKGETL
jgi:tRNA A37 methylthiotransferase MiaB